MPSIIVDSGPLYALFNRDDRHHPAALDFVRRLQDELLTNLLVLGEVAYLLHRSTAARRDFLGWAHGALTIDIETVRDLPRIVALLDKYADLPADFADASLIALAERVGVSRVASVDRDFHIYRRLGNEAINVFFDLG